MRTQLASVQQASNQKWSVTFDTFRGDPGSESRMGSIESAAVFDTEDEAYEGGKRALDMLEQTGYYPNMCEKF